MKVAIVSGARSLQPTGIGLAERGLLGALRVNSGPIEVNVRVVGGRAGRRYAQSIGARWYPVWPGRVPRRAWRSADLIHLLGLDVPPPPRQPFVVNIYDVAAWRFPDEAKVPAWTQEIVRRADRVITSTHCGVRELQQTLGVSAEKIRVIALGPGQTVPRSVETLSDAELAAMNLRRPFVLRIGGYTQRKNVPVLLEAWPEVHRQTGALLALMGPPHPAREAQLAAAAFPDGVVALSYLPPVLAARLLRSASALVSPSIYEGFGLPPLEAMGAGVPVVAVRSASVEEVCGDAAVLVANDPQALAAGLVWVLRDDALRGRLVDAGLRRAAGFTWEEAAASVVSVYRELLS